MLQEQPAVGKSGKLEWKRSVNLEVLWVGVTAVNAEGDKENYILIFVARFPVLN